MSDTAHDQPITYSRWRTVNPARNEESCLDSLDHIKTRVDIGLPYLWAGTGPVVPDFSAISAFHLSVKRLLDIVGAIFALIFFLPVLVALAVTIKLTSPGPVLFSQERVGQRGVLIRIMKFRTMYTDKSDRTGTLNTQPDDARVTPVGRLLRCWSLDELPQLFNVLIGNMSLVGPRPHVPGQLAAGRPYAEMVPYYPLRALAKPGITGWAQVNGYRGPTDNLERAQLRVDCDIAYIQNFSIFLDLKIIVLTIWREFLTGTGS